MPRYAISDIHGCLDTFQELLRQIRFTPADTLYLLGDYIDRGPDSKGVIDYIWQLQKAGYTLHCLRGNHEEMTLANIQGGSTYPYHDQALLDSFGVSAYRDIPAEYARWMNDLPYYFETEGYILVHAGLNFRHENPLADTESMLWIRHCEKNANLDWLAGRIVVHGHTPTPKIVIEMKVTHLDLLAVLNIDAGCVFAQQGAGFGYLCAFNLDTRELSFVKRNLNPPSS
ncbi:MAG: serine/threonine protein phosphatase [Bacteroidetes bacterium]|nr:MAG: serine/threonine protein phosphatase [Bacteroidota bacterium]